MAGHLSWRVAWSDDGAMTGRMVMWAGWATVVLSVAGLAVYFAVAGFHLVDTVGVIGAVVGVVGLAAGLCGLVLARRDTNAGAGAGASGGIGAGGVHNQFSGGTAYGPVVMGRDISGSVYGSTPPASPPPASPPVAGGGSGNRPDQEASGSSGESRP